MQAIVSYSLDLLPSVLQDKCISLPPVHLCLCYACKFAFKSSMKIEGQITYYEICILFLLHDQDVRIMLCKTFYSKSSNSITLCQQCHGCGFDFQGTNHQNVQLQGLACEVCAHAVNQLLCVSKSHFLYTLHKTHKLNCDIIHHNNLQIQHTNQFGTRIKKKHFVVVVVFFCCLLQNIKTFPLQRVFVSCVRH